MKKAIFFFLLSSNVYFSNGQTGIGTTSPNSNSVLEISSNNKGILIPRIALDVGRNSPSPLSAHVAGMIIYNTASITGTPASNSVTPGFYYNNGDHWVRIANASEGDATSDPWIDDNPNTQVKLGTFSDGAARPESAAFVAKDNGKVGIGTSNPVATLHVNDGNFRLENSDNWNAYKGVTYSNNKYPQLFLFQAMGTKVSPSYPQNTTTLGVFKAANAIDSTGGAGFRIVSTEQQTASSHGTAIAFFTTSNASSANVDRLLIDQNGNIRIAANVDALNPAASRPGARLVVDGYTRLGTADVTADALTTASDRAGMIRYNPNGTLQYHDNANWVTASQNTPGDLKQGVQAGDHNGWIKLDGRAISNLSTTQQAKAKELFGATATNLPNAANAYLTQNGATLGSVSGTNSRTIAQNQLPNISLTGTTEPNGGHAHNYTDNGVGPWQTAIGSGNTLQDDGFVYKTTDFNPDHSHTFTTSSLNGEVTQQALDITPKSLSVNTFVYLGF